MVAGRSVEANAKTNEIVILHRSVSKPALRPKQQRAGDAPILAAFSTLGELAK